MIPLTRSLLTLGIVILAVTMFAPFSNHVSFPVVLPDVERFLTFIIALLAISQRNVCRIPFHQRFHKLTYCIMLLQDNSTNHIYCLQSSRSLPTWSRLLEERSRRIGIWTFRPFNRSGYFNTTAVPAYRPGILCSCAPLSRQHQRLQRP